MMDPMMLKAQRAPRPSPAASNQRYTLPALRPNTLYPRRVRRSRGSVRRSRGTRVTIRHHFHP
jgi:hypothetical protein